MRTTVGFVAVLLVSSTRALYKDETGVNDFLIATTGHGPVKIIHSTSTAVMTAATPSVASLLDDRLDDDDVSSCFVASRSLDTGKLLWRRDVCEAQGDSPAVVATIGSDWFATTDSSGLLRGWAMSDGSLLWDVPAPSEGSFQRGLVFGVTLGSKSIVAATSVVDGGEILTLYNAPNGRKLGTLSVGDVAPESKFLYVGSDETNGLFALAGIVSKDGAGRATTSGEVMVFVKIQLDGDDGLSDGISITDGSKKQLLHSSEAFLASTMRVLTVKGEPHLTALSSDGSSTVEFSLLSTKSGQTALSTEASPFAAMDSCASMTVTAKGSTVEAYLGEVSHSLDVPETLAERSKQLTSPLELTGDEISTLDPLTGVSALSCSGDSSVMLLTTALGSTKAVKFTKKESSASVEVLWEDEEGMATVTSGVLIDASHSAAFVDAETAEERAKTLKQLDVTSRLQSQIEAVTSMFKGESDETAARDQDFGFVKVAVLLSEQAHRMWGIPTAGASRGKFVWSLPLPQDATWHILVHGIPSGTTMHGTTTQSHELLVLSSLPDGSIHWNCVDGTNGKLHGQGNGVPAQSPPIAQIVPIFGGTGASCHQAAFVIHSDRTVSLVPDTPETRSAALRQLESHKNGFFTHVVEKEAGTLESFRLVAPKSDRGAFGTQVAGRAAFAGERIVQISYPQRDEAIQSPVTVLGDDSLLLKYLNPHLAAVITMSTTSKDESNEIANALDPGKSGGRKPLGVTQGDGKTPEQATAEVPNLFVNLVDTVSGRILYRVSHANALETEVVPTVISENWVIYAFLSKATRRTELGVLTLHEGMIDKAGLTAFTSPDQVTSFSSLEARESKPVVLSKAYAIVKPVTALGVTTSKGGISTKHVLIASGDDRITSVNRNLLEPRRPTGEVKPHEKEEGLFQYHPLVPLVSMSSPSYDLTIQSVTSIISSPTDLESQSLILAYGGPDIFFSRVSPSQGFDLLPESFNRPLLTLVVVALLIGLGILRGMSGKKLIRTGWS